MLSEDPDLWCGPPKPHGLPLHSALSLFNLGPSSLVHAYWRCNALRPGSAGDIWSLRGGFTEVLADLELAVRDFITGGEWQRQRWCVHCFKCLFFYLERKTQKTKDVYIYDCYNFNWYILLNVKHWQNPPMAHTITYSQTCDFGEVIFVSCWPVFQSDEQMSPFTSNFTSDGPQTLVQKWNREGQERFGDSEHQWVQSSRKYEHLRPLVLSFGKSSRPQWKKGYQMQRDNYC